MNETNNFSENETIILDDLKFDFKTVFQKLVNEDIDPTVVELSQQINQEDEKTKKRDETTKEITYPKLNEYFKNKLTEHLVKIEKDFNITYFDEFFDILVNFFIDRQSREDNKQFFITLYEIYEIFSKYGFRSIPNATIDKIITSLQWNTLNPKWIDYKNFQNYFRELPEDIDENQILKIWNFIELARIKNNE